ncbi:MAG: hypothetical protein NVS2B11_05410 [Acetobacteraceae bacterium]
MDWVSRMRLYSVYVADLPQLEGRRRPAPGRRSHLVRLFLLGGLQGAVGWFMVASGFAEGSTAVSAYRLVIHLSLALTLYAAILWTALTLWRPVAATVVPRLRVLLVTVCAMVGLTILAGGFVAGLKAGLAYNTFPLMDGQLVPESYAALQPFFRNLTENIAAVQFDHRLLATITGLLALGTAGWGWRASRDPAVRRAMLALGLAVTMQYVLGVTTLLLVVPVALGTLHQAAAILLLTASLVALHLHRRAGQ